MTKELRVLELFSGIGAQHKALTNIGIDALCTQCEIDKYAIQAYNAIHGETKNLGDISAIDPNQMIKDEYDLITYSSPCQDFSFAGLQKGGEKGSGTRSSLLWEVEKIVKQVRPKYLLMENVKALVSKKFLPCFEKWVETLNSYGYKTYWKVLNAKNYGIPQNRERVFAVSIRNDIDQSFEFPLEQKLEKRLKDVLESNVDAKYYLSERAQNTFMNRSITKALEGQGFRFKPHNPSKADIAFAVTTRAGGRMDDNFVFNEDYNDNKFVEFNESMINEPIIVASRGRNPNNPSDRTVGAPTEQRLEPNSQGIANTLTSVQKDNYVLEPNVLVAKRTEYGKMVRKAYELGELKESRHNMTQLEPRTDGISNTLTSVQKDNYVLEPKIEVLGNYKPSGHECGRIMSINGISPTIKENHVAVCAIAEPQLNHNIDYRIRKLTPRECYRLMGFSDEDFDKVKSVGMSDTQCYKQAGNSIVVNCLMAIFTNMFKDTDYMK